MLFAFTLRSSGLSSERREDTFMLSMKPTILPVPIQFFANEHPGSISGTKSSTRLVKTQA